MTRHVLFTPKDCLVSPLQGWVEAWTVRTWIGMSIRYETTEVHKVNLVLRSSILSVD